MVFAFRCHAERRITADTVTTPRQKIRLCEADFPSAEAISIEESAKEIASSSLLAMTKIPRH